MKIFSGNLPILHFDSKNVTAMRNRGMRLKHRMMTERNESTKCDNYCDSSLYQSYPSVETMMPGCDCMGVVWALICGVICGAKNAAGATGAHAWYGTNRMFLRLRSSAVAVEAADATGAAAGR